MGWLRWTRQTRRGKRPESLPQRTNACQRAVPSRPFEGEAALPIAPHQLDAARREWLAAITRQYEGQPDATSAMQLASAEWKCGEYERALGHFIAARALSPSSPDTHASVVHACAMLGERTLECEAMEHGLGRHPHDPRLLLHAARRRLPEDWEGARSLLETVGDPTCALFLSGIRSVVSGEPPEIGRVADPRQQAMLAGLRWVMERSSDRSIHAGIPTDVLFRALEAAPATGLTLECGVYFGRSLRLIASRSPGIVHGFDSFQGLPEAWSASEGAGAYSTGGRLPVAPPNARLHAGWFEHTLAPFFATETQPIRLLHVDCDLYSSTRTVLEQALPRLVPGSVIVFDDLLGYPGYEQHELRALDEVLDGAGIGWELIAAAFLGREAAIRITRA